MATFGPLLDRGVVGAGVKRSQAFLNEMMMDNVAAVQEEFQAFHDGPPVHIRLPPVVARLYWSRGLRARLEEVRL